MDLTDKESKILDLFSRKMELSHLEKIKLVYGWRILIADLKKLFFMYSFAFLIGCLIETFIIHTAFYAFRQVAFGVHSKNFYTCLIVSCLTFPGSVFLLNTLEISTIYIWITYFIAAIPLLLFAPIGTNINAIKGREHALYLKKKIYIRLVLLGVILTFFPITITKFLIMGLLIESILVLISIIKKEGNKKC